ncbi:type IV pilin protein [Pseudomonas sp. GD04019]|uniref:type IV pilin protein n=1 Tax=Pseudomonas sp. GD04019 TaxID=2975420 RepID=UPI00244B0CA5|nr:type IV pilin protein [Pseudomonas sp. GD04019]
MEPKTSSGFTLIELMIAIVIIGVLVAIAMPIYQEYIKKSRRAEAAAVLTEAAQRLEVFYSQNGRYCDTSACASIAPVFQASIPASGTAYYNVGASAITATSYTLNAAPVGAMVGDECGTFTITQAGQTSVSGGSLGAAACWRR